MPPPSSARLWLVPGELLVLWLVQIEHGPRACLALPPERLMEGLRAAAALLSFSCPCRSEMPLEELLPWAGNV